MANLPQQLLDVLRCPVTGSVLVEDGGRLISTAPGPDGVLLEYRLEEGIPVLLRPELLENPARP
ncbi:uncharacterized protein YbaR (Trm112 family) [Arthrobacter sp. CAN_A6]|uniref:Trm112 family protein n=1 Tax=Arthrobacter sp. CAN_A6 TaxID=2787721 RepID=UPI0018CA8CD6